jgi:hypothetical protein
MEHVILGSKKDMGKDLLQQGYSFHNGFIYIEYSDNYVYLIKIKKEVLNKAYLKSEIKQFKDCKYFIMIRYYSMVDLIRTLALFKDSDIVMDDDYGHFQKLNDFMIKTTGKSI